MSRHLRTGTVLAILLGLLAGCEPRAGIGPGESNLTRAQRLTRATAIRDAARAQGITNGALMVALLAEEETHLSHCASEFRACRAPAHADCGGAAVIAGGGDGPCALMQGGIGMFQLDDGTISQTIAAHPNVLSMAGNTQAGIDRLIDKLIVSSYLAISTRAEAIAFLNNLRIDDANWDSYIRTLARYWNGCRPTAPCWANRYAAYDQAGRTLLTEMGRDFWYGTTTPPPAGTGWLSSPIASPTVTSHVSHANGTAWRRYDCTAITRAGHRGTDFGVPIGTPVHAAAAGTVIRSTTGCANDGSLTNYCGRGFGNHVIVQHDGGMATLYAHFSPDGTQIADGARVECGQLLGHSGHSGHSTGPHLHFEVRSGVSDVGTYFVTNNTVDPYGGACSSQTASLWTGGATPTASCMASTTDNAIVVTATYPRGTSCTPGASVTQRFTWRNTGTTTWAAGGYVMRHAVGAFGTPPEIALPAGAMVAPGAQIALEVTVTCPTAAGTHHAGWRMARAGGTAFGREGTLDLTVPAAPRGCRSATLSRDVASGDCVQVTYPSCGLSRCAWYACQNGAWACTDGSMCAGTANPHAACVVAVDAGVDANTCANGAPLGSACTTAGECCAGLDCSQDSAGDHTCCSAQGTPCGRSTDCCGTMLCSSGFCACVPDGQLCWNDRDCCDGHACIAGACRACTAGAPIGSSCATASDCCYPLRCQAGAGGGANQCCIGGGNRCQADSDCCGDMTCVTGHCACRERGQSCSNTLDCCGAALCTNGTCGG